MADVCVQIRGSSYRNPFLGPVMLPLSPYGRASPCLPPSDSQTSIKRVVLSCVGVVVVAKGVLLGDYRWDYQWQETPPIHAPHLIRYQYGSTEILLI